MAGFNELADADLGDVVGAFRRRGRGRQSNGSRMVDRRMLIPSTPGVPASGLRDQPLGLGATAFTPTSGTLLLLQASPQRPFKGERLVVDITRTGATSTGLVTIARLDIGTDNQLVGSGAISAAAFAPTAFGTRLSLAPATPGILVSITFNVSASPGAGDRIDIGATLFGLAAG